MKIIRRLLVGVGVLIVLVAVLLAAALTSPLQTWFAQLMLDRQPGVHGSIGSVSAAFGKVEVSDLRLETDRWLLTLPSLTAHLPVTQASRDQNFEIHSVVAKGWTLDLSRTAEPNQPNVKTPPTPSPAGATEGMAATTGPVTAQKVERIFRDLLGGWQLPADVSLDGVDLEGDVILAVSPDRDPVQIHVFIKGGGLTAGHEGGFDFHAEGPDPWQRANSIAAKGRLSMSLKSPRTLGRVAMKADVTARGGIFSEDYAVAVDLAVERAANEVTFTAGIDRRSGRVVALSGRFTPAKHQVAGEWKIDGRESDLPLPLLTDHPLPPLAMAGAGSFEADTASTGLHILGHLNGAGMHWGILSPTFERFGDVAFSSHFDLNRAGQIIRVEHFELKLLGAKPIAFVHSLQPFELEVDSGNLKVMDPQGDWLEATIQGFPLEWLSIAKGGVGLLGGDVTGQVAIRATGGGMALRTLTALTAADVSVRVADKILMRQLDLSLVLQADYGPQGWQARWAPFTISRAGRPLAGSEGSASHQGEAGEPVVVNGKWNADITALVPQLVGPPAGQIPAGAASGDFSASIGSEVVCDATGTVSGLDPTHTVSGSLHVERGAEGRVSFGLPLKISTGKNITEITAEGEWYGSGVENRINAKVTSDDADSGHLRLLAGPLAAAVRFPLAEVVSGWAGGPADVVSATDREPFWRNWTGTVNLGFGKVRARDHVFQNVSASFEIEPGAIHLVRGQGGLGQRSPAQVEGILSFDATAESPYRLAATASLSDLDPSPLIVPAQVETDPVFEGHFSVAAKFAGEGRTLPDLVRRTQEDYHLTSANGIIRLLRISVADAFPEDAPESGSAEALDTAGSLLNRLLGNGKRGFGSGEKKLSPTAESVLNFTSLIAELAYDRVDITATRGSDGAIRLTAIEMVSPNERLTGSGQISWLKDRPLRERPLNVDLTLGLRGDIMGVAAKAGLMGKPKDELGYTALAESLHFGGSLAKLDADAWHDVLAKAATKNPVVAKKAAK